MRNLKDVLLLALILLIKIIFPSDMLAQCPSGGLDIFSQQSVTDFQTAYPNCTQISGDVIINDSSDVVNGTYTTDITSLSGLNKIEIITGSLIIRSCPDLPSLSGLDNVTSVGSDLFIQSNDHAGLTTFAGLGALTSVGNSITVRLNHNLESFSGMGTIVGALTGQIKITDNPKLTSIAPLSGITSTGTDVTIKRNKLTNLDGLQNLEIVSGFLNVREEPSLTSIAELSNLTTVGNNVLNVSDNPLLNTLSGLENVTTLNGDLYLSGNGELGDCDAVCHILNDNIANNYVVGSNKTGSSCQYLTALQDHCTAMLPIELTYFSSHQALNSIYLEWETSSEINNAGQFVEKSQNGRDWQEIAWVDGNGTTNDLQEYHFKDCLPYDGINYYRLRQVDYDGREEYSHVISEYFKGEELVAQMYPNPARDWLFVQHHLAGNAQVAIFDAYGKNVLNVHEFTSGIDLTSLPEGIYFVQVYNESTVLDWQRMVISRANY